MDKMRHEKLTGRHDAAHGHDGDSTTGASAPRGPTGVRLGMRTGTLLVLVLALAGPGCRKKSDKAAVEAVDGKAPVVPRRAKGAADAAGGGKLVAARDAGTAEPVHGVVRDKPPEAARPGEAAKTADGTKLPPQARPTEGAQPSILPTLPVFPGAPTPTVAVAPPAPTVPSALPGATGVPVPGARPEEPKGAGEIPVDQKAAAHAEREGGPTAGVVARDRRAAEALPAEAPESPPSALPAPTAEAPQAAEAVHEPALDVSGYISAMDLELVLGAKPKFVRSDLPGVAPTPTYNVLYYKPDKGDYFGVSVQVWRDSNLAESRTRFNTMRNTYSNVAPTSKVAEQGFRSFYSGVVTVAFADPRRPIVAAVSCSTKLCTADKLIALTQRVSERLR